MSSNNSSTTAKIASSASSRSFPWLGLLALAMTGFICIMTETIPAGLLPQISKGLYISEAMAGQLVTVHRFFSGCHPCSYSYPPMAEASAVTSGYLRVPGF
ncbi:hypothetical protein [Paenibacillus sp. MZ03-122A]|uniref:hypothetical protein n=1 Tax=Paenibacillus sp. MZ03-122A TaxID=2962033 RepID=UPI00349FA4DB